jgi:hypothetical protein
MANRHRPTGCHVAHRFIGSPTNISAMWPPRPNAIKFVGHLEPTNLITGDKFASFTWSTNLQDEVHHTY